MKRNQARTVFAGAEKPVAKITRISTHHLLRATQKINASRSIYWLMAVIALAVVMLLWTQPHAALRELVVVLAGSVLLGVAAVVPASKHVKAGIRRDPTRAIPLFTLSLDNEVISLEPGRTWLQLDHYKWVVRGLIEEPQMLHVFPDGSVEINAEKISIADTAGPEKLEHQINKHFATDAHKPAAASAGIPGARVAQPADDPRRFRVKLDHLGHVVIQWGHGIDREETGLRGIATLITNGLIRKPDQFRVDPMQRAVEIDDIRYECNEAGVKRLEEAFNTRYAPRVEARKAVAIEIKENVAASTGFDIHFRTSHAGVSHEVKGHLTQELLDILQDPLKCDLLQPGIHLLLSPPNLLIRRRRPDMGEEKVSELPDVNILRSTAAQLQHVFNHPLLRRHGVSAAQGLPDTEGQPEQIVEIKMVRNPSDAKLLWFQCVSTRADKHESKAFTHHNIAELQHGGVFLPHLEVCLSLDHKRLSIHDRRTHKEEAIVLDPADCSDAILGEASRMLTRALKHAALRSTGRDPIRVKLDSPVRAPNAVPAKGAVTPPGPAATPARALDPAIVALFHETDPVRINQEIFRRLSDHLGIAAHEAYFGLPMVFDNRRFEILNFEQQEIASVLELRGTDFYGFYLSHVSEKKTLLVYACNGMHLEWGPDKSFLQATVKSEPEEYKGSVLLGMAQNKKDEFVFVVQPEFKKWIEPREMPFTDENLQFLTVADLAAAPDDFRFIWPERMSPRA